MEGDCVWINVSKDDAPDVLHLNGYSYAGGTLTITETEERVPHTDGAINSAETVKRSKEATELRQQLESVLARRFHPTEALLDLSALGADPILSNMGTFESESTAMKAFRALLVIVSETYKNPRDKEESIQAVTVANNQIEDVSSIYQLALELPGLKRLDLSNNKFDSISKLAKWKGQFRNLEELHLTGNGVVTAENYVAELLTWFPYLQILNGQQVRTRQQIEEYVKARSGTPLPTSGSNVRDVQNITELFVRDFFPLFDNNRAALADKYYDTDSLFSLSVPTAPRPSNAWAPYVKHSRNLEKAIRTNRSAITKRVHTGAKHIADFWKTLPATKHYTPESGHLIVDSNLIPNVCDPNGPGGAPGMIVTVYSQYDEADTSQDLFGTRGFTRTFVLGPAKAGRPSEITYRVISDQLILHTWTPRERPAEAPVAAVAPAAVPDTTVAKDSIDQMKAELTAKLSEQTGMTLEYSKMCLEGAPNWNYDLAIAAFHENKAALPPTAFINPGA